MNKLSVVVTVYNDEAKLARTLTSIRWADELIVINCSSTDKSLEIAKQFTKQVFTRPNHLMLNRNKNFGFGLAKHPWILSLDSDEEITPELAKEIKAVINQKSEIAGYWIPRKNIIFGKWIQHGLWWPDKQLRLFQMGKGKFPCRHVHEYLEVDGKLGELANPYIHYNYDSVSQYLWKLDNIYTGSEVDKLKAAHYQLNWFDALRFPVSDFLKIYFAQSGYKDGLHGLVLAILQAFYSFVVFVKLWESSNFVEHDLELNQLNKEKKYLEKQVNYWWQTAKINSLKNPLTKVWLKLLRRYGTG